MPSVAKSLLFTLMFARKSLMRALRAMCHAREIRYARERRHADESYAPDARDEMLESYLLFTSAHVDEYEACVQILIRASANIMFCLL